MHRICFIDDDEEFEIPLFCDVFGEVFDVIAASDYAKARSLIDGRKGWRPNLFVLDLYFPCGPADEETLKALRAQPLSLEHDNAEIRPTYGNYVRAKARLASVLAAWRQNADGGLNLAERIAADYPDVPIVFYSRKATFEDVVRCMVAKNVRCVERKPTGKDPDETIELTKSAQPRLARQFGNAISNEDLMELRRRKEAAVVLTELLREFG